MSTVYSRRAQRLVGLQAHQLNRRELEADDALAAARGIVIGCVISLGMWVALVALLLLLS